MMFVARRGDHALPAKHPIPPEASLEKVKMPRAVEQRKNQCLWADGGRGSHRHESLL